MGGFCTPSYTELPTATTRTDGSDIPDWVATAGREIFNSATGIAGSDYPSFTKKTDLPSYEDGSEFGSKFTSDERAGMDILRQGAENYMPYMNRASRRRKHLRRQGYDSQTRSQSFWVIRLQRSHPRRTCWVDYQGATREELLGDPFSLETAQPFMDIYQSCYGPRRS